jgi:putative endonuclease
MFEAGKFVARSLGLAIKPLLNVCPIPIMTTWTVYIVRCGDDTLYTGIAKDAARRVDEHNSNDGLAASYTRGRRPVVLVYQEPAPTRSDALKREYQIKQMSREAKERLLVAV